MSSTLFEKMVAMDNIDLAYRKARRRKRYREDVAEFEYFREDRLQELQRELQDERYCPGPYYNFRIRDPKPRLISAASFRDRVVHHAIMNVVEPILDRSLISDTYSCRQGKGTHRAADRAQTFVRRYRYVLKCDVVQFFPSIDHEILSAMLARKIRDEKVLSLFRRIINGGAHVLDKEYHHPANRDNNLGFRVVLFAAGSFGCANGLYGRHFHVKETPGPSSRAVRPKTSSVAASPVRDRCHLFLYMRKL